MLECGVDVGGVDRIWGLELRLALDFRLRVKVIWISLSGDGRFWFRVRLKLGLRLGRGHLCGGKCPMHSRRGAVLYWRHPVLVGLGSSRGSGHSSLETRRRRRADKFSLCPRGNVYTARQINR